MDPWDKLGISVCTTICIGILAAVGCFAAADGAIDYCYIKFSYIKLNVSDPPKEVPSAYYLHGYRPWREDNTIGIFPSLDEAKNAANALSCPLHK